LCVGVVVDSEIKMDYLDKKITKCVLCEAELKENEICVCSSCENRSITQELNRTGLVPEAS